MKIYLGILTTILMTGALFLGMDAGAGAQQAPPASQQPMEIPAQYPSQQQGGPGQAGPPSQGEPQQSQPGDAGAARVSFIHGDVSTQHNGSADWIAATINTPVVTGDHVSTGQNASAEIQLDHANVLRLSDQSTANIVNLSRTQMQLQVGQGLANYEVFKNNEASVEIDTPNVAIRPDMGEGSYRIQVNSDDETIIDVRKGSAEISTPQGSTKVGRDQRITIQGTADNAQYQVSGAPGRDDWDKWNSDRDHASRARKAGSTPIQTTQARRIWMATANGRMFRTTAAFGFLRKLPVGRRTAMAAGCMSLIMAGLGFPMSLGAGRRITTGAGSFMAGTGVGGRGRFTADITRCGRRPTFPFSALAAEAGEQLDSALAAGFGSVGWLPCGPGDRFFPWYGRGDQPRELGERHITFTITTAA